MAGAVPVVFDPVGQARHLPGYARYLPPHTFVNVADFASPAALAAHLIAVAANKTLYNSYLWPRRATSEAIRARWPEHAMWPGVFDEPRGKGFGKGLGEGFGSRRQEGTGPEGKGLASLGRPPRAERSECALARSALRSIATARERGEQPARLAPDLSCLPPRQLCHHLPRGTCVPAGPDEAIRPEMRGRPARGKRSANV